MCVSSSIHMHGSGVHSLAAAPTAAVVLLWSTGRARGIQSSSLLLSLPESLEAPADELGVGGGVVERLHLAHVVLAAQDARHALVHALRDDHTGPASSSRQGDGQHEVGGSRGGCVGVGGGGVVLTLGLRSMMRFLPVTPSPPACSTRNAMGAASYSRRSLPRNSTSTRHSNHHDTPPTSVHADGASLGLVRAYSALPAYHRGSWRWQGSRRCLRTAAS